MAEIFRDGTWQSVAEKEHPQLVREGHWTPLRWIDKAGKEHTYLYVVAPGIQVVDWSVRVAPSDRRRFATIRVERYPWDPTDNGTHWIGPIEIPAGTAWSWSSTALDHKGAVVGKAYGVSVLIQGGAARFTQWIHRLGVLEGIAR